MSSGSGKIKYSPLDFNAPLFLLIKVPLFFLFLINIILSSDFWKFSIIFVVLSFEKSSTKSISMSLKN